jgi:hypothetical protein
MTSEEIIRVAKIAIDYWVGPGLSNMTDEDEQAILDRYYNKYGMKEEDISEAMWYELAEKIR